MSLTPLRQLVMMCSTLCLLAAWPHDSAGQNVYANRFEWDGTLDPSFPNGSLLFEGMRVRAAVTDSSRRIVLAGSADGVFMTARLTPNGALDTTFGGGDGIVYTSFSGPAEAMAVAIRPNGSIVTAGTVFVRSKHGFAVACYTSAGTLCPGLNQGWGTLPSSRIETWFPSDAQATGIAVSTDGSFVVAGGRHLARYSLYGTPAAGFGDGGRRVLDADVGIREIALDAGGKIVAAGALHTVEDEYRFAVMRLGPDGEWDPGFGTNGIAMFYYGCSWALDCLHSSAALALAIDDQGRIVAGGISHPASLGGFWLALTRVLPTGDVDPEFGYVSIPPSGTSFMTDVRISGGNRIWAAGHHGGFPFLMRFTNGGDVDYVFGTVKTQGCPGFNLNDAPQVVEQNFLVTTGPNTISVARKAVVITQCYLPLDF